MAMANRAASKFAEAPGRSGIKRPSTFTFRLISMRAASTVRACASNRFQAGYVANLLVRRARRLRLYRGPLDRQPAGATLRTKVRTSRGCRAVAHHRRYPRRARASRRYLLEREFCRRALVGSLHGPKGGPGGLQLIGWRL